MTLYFLDSNCKEHEIGPVSLVKGELASESLYGLIEEDLETRKPDFTSHYCRMWWDDHSRFWVDFGSHTEFYIAHEPYPERSERAAHEPYAGQSCEDACDL